MDALTDVSQHEAGSTLINVSCSKVLLIEGSDAPVPWLPQAQPAFVCSLLVLADLRPGPPKASGPACRVFADQKVDLVGG